MTEDEFNHAKAILKREYPHLLTAELERMARTCYSAPWFKELLKRSPRSVGLCQEKNDTDVEKVGKGKEAEEPEEEAANLGKTNEAEEPEESDESAPHPMVSVDLEQAKSELSEKRSAQIREMEFLTQLILSSQVSRVQHMRISIAFGLLKGSLDPKEVANHFEVSDETIRVQTKKVEETLTQLGESSASAKDA